MIIVGHSVRIMTFQNTELFRAKVMTTELDYEYMCLEHTVFRTPARERMLFRENVLENKLLFVFMELLPRPINAVLSIFMFQMTSQDLHRYLEKKRESLQAQSTRDSSRPIKNVLSYLEAVEETLFSNNLRASIDAKVSTAHIIWYVEGGVFACIWHVMHLAHTYLSLTQVYLMFYENYASGLLASGIHNNKLYYFIILLLLCWMILSKTLEIFCEQVE